MSYYDIDHSITIGIELEVCCDDQKQAKNILKIDNILSNWDIKSDCSVKNGLEISSQYLILMKKV